MTLQERLMSKINFDSESKCWNWTAAKDKDGYGQIRIDGKSERAHRVSYELFYGTDPAHLCVLHNCDNPACINPDHLFLGTHSDNMADRGAKGRQARPNGTTNGRSKLTEAEVLDIRASTDTGSSLATKYNVTRQLISLIKLRKTWKHI
jgi:hypothetical protein